MPRMSNRSFTYAQLDLFGDVVAEFYESREVERFWNFAQKF